MGRDKSGTALQPIALAAILRAHANELKSAELPTPHPLLGIPTDLPENLRQQLDPQLLQVEIDGHTYAAKPISQSKRQDEVISDWMSHFEFSVGMFKFWANGTEGLSGAYEKNVASEKDAHKRMFDYEALLQCSDDPNSEPWRSLHLKEARHHESHGNKLLARRYRFLASEKKTNDLVLEVEKSAQAMKPGFERSLLYATAAEIALREKEKADPKAILKKIKAIPGTTAGTWLRIRAHMRAAKFLGPDHRKHFLDAARAEVAACPLPLLKKQLGTLIREPEK